MLVPREYSACAGEMAIARTPAEIESKDRRNPDLSKLHTGMHDGKAAGQTVCAEHTILPATAATASCTMGCQQSSTNKLEPYAGPVPDNIPPLWTLPSKAVSNFSMPRKKTEYSVGTLPVTAAGSRLPILEMECCGRKHSILRDPSKDGGPIIAVCKRHNRRAFRIYQVDRPFIANSAVTVKSYT